MKPLSTTNKFNRTEAYHYVQGLREPGAIIDEWAIDSLLNHFAPAVPKTAKTREQWVAKAVATNKSLNTMPSLRFLASIDGTLYAADGHRVHYAPTDLPTGLYEPKTMQPVEDDVMDYPAVQRVILGHNKTASTVTDIEYIAPDDLKKPRLALLNPHHDLANSNTTRIAINQQYLNDATNNDLAMEILEVSTSAGLTGRSEFGKFVIMPTKI